MKENEKKWNEITIKSSFGYNALKYVALKTMYEFSFNFDKPFACSATDVFGHFYDEQMAINHYLLRWYHIVRNYNLYY